jgi:hypothetical protein
MPERLAALLHLRLEPHQIAAHHRRDVSIDDR